MNQNKRSKCELAIKSANPPPKLIPKSLRGRKRWQLAQQRSKNGGQQLRNETLEITYFNILRAFKSLFKNSETLAFERNYKHDNTESNLAMHCFMTDSFYLFLECEFDFCYSLQYAFFNCKHEEYLLGMLSSLTPQYRIKEVSLKPDFTTFYTNVLTYQPEHFRYFL